MEGALRRKTGRKVVVFMLGGVDKGILVSPRKQQLTDSAISSKGWTRKFRKSFSRRNSEIVAFRVSQDDILDESKFTGPAMQIYLAWIPTDPHGPKDWGAAGWKGDVRRLLNTIA